MSARGWGCGCSGDLGARRNPGVNFGFTPGHGVVCDVHGRGKSALGNCSVNAASAQARQKLDVTQTQQAVTVRFYGSAGHRCDGQKGRRRGLDYFGRLHASMVEFGPLSGKRMSMCVSRTHAVVPCEVVQRCAQSSLRPSHPML